jgi:hypothetical protein
MDPALQTGKERQISGLDLRALDVIGWNIAPGGDLDDDDLDDDDLDNVNLSALQSQAQQALARRIGKTVSWLNSNATQAASLLSQNRNQDVAAMLQGSGVVYNWGTEEGDPYWWGWEEGDPFWQVLNQTVEFSTLSEVEFTPSDLSGNLSGNSGSQSTGVGLSSNLADLVNQAVNVVIAGATRTNAVVTSGDTPSLSGNAGGVIELDLGGFSLPTSSFVSAGDSRQYDEGNDWLNQWNFQPTSGKPKDDIAQPNWGVEDWDGPW